MSVDTPPSGILSRQKLNGIYWKTFVGFVNKENDAAKAENGRERQEKPRQIYKREGSFEYMELTAKDNVSLQSESESCASTDNSSSDSTTGDRSTSMYAVLNMTKKKEIQISDEIAIFEGSPIRRHHPFTLTLSSIPASPKCSPILHVGLLPDDLTLAPSPITGNCQRAVTLHNIDKDEAIFSDVDDIPYEDDSFDRSDPTSPSMEPAPWKDQCLSIQRWMVPHILPDNDDELLTLPDSVPLQEFEYCHYVPTLEAILEESEDSADSRDDSGKKLHKSSSCSDNTQLDRSEVMTDGASWNSTNDLSSSLAQSQDDLFSITSTCGSLGSMRRVSTFENLSFDEEGEEETDGSSDEFDRICDDVTILENELGRVIDDVTIHEKGLSQISDNVTIPNSETDRISDDVITSGNIENHDVTIHNDSYGINKNYKHNVPELSQELFPEENISANVRVEDEEIHLENLMLNENSNSPKASKDEASDVSSSPGVLDSSREVIPASSVQSLLDLLSRTSSGRGSPLVHSDQLDAVATRSNSPGNVPRDSGVDDVISEPANEIVSASSKTEIDRDSQIGSEISIPGLPEELYFDSRDIPKIVVMFAQEELAKERARQLSDDNSSNGDMTPVQYRKRSSTYDPLGYQDSAYSSHEGVHRKINQMKASEASRLSTLSSSTPELSLMTEDALPYIPVSYASEAAARRKKKRRATISSAESANRKRNAVRANQTKTLIGGGGFGNGFSSLRKKFKNRNRIGTSLRRSQSEKPQLSYSSPDVSGPMARFLNSPRRRPREKAEVPPKVEGRRRGFRSVVTSIFRRLSSRFTSQSPSPTRNDDNGNDVIEKKSPSKNSLGLIKEESHASESVSTYNSARESAAPSIDGHHTGSSPKRRVNSNLAPPSERESEEFRQRSYSVPLRPRTNPSPYKYPASENSDVFESINSTDSNSLDKTIYV